MKNNNNTALSRSCSIALSLAGSALLAAPGFATEGGASSYPMGAESYFTGIMPSPGIYGVLYGEHYEADNLRGNDGRKLPVDFRLQVNALVPRLIWVSDKMVLGGALAAHAMAPLVEVKARVNGYGERQQGLGDVTFGAGLGYHYSQNLHVVYALDITAPTGRYERNDLVNLGRNYWMFEPLVAITYVEPRGLNADAKIMYDFNMKNPDTHYRSGQEFHVDYSVGWGVADGWVIGVGGYIYRQTTDDRQDGERIDDNKGRAFAIGPSIKYSSPNGWFVTAKWQQETDVRNRAQGNAYWLRLVMPL
ncbi:SphA family protein [Pseudomonas putida]|uniref:SphA family protein n=1 Tax=Pseudomonas putida TaxID=303 RepID=UPI00300EE768